MTADSESTPGAPEGLPTEFRDHALFLDLEVSMRGRLRQVGAVLGGRTFASLEPRQAPAALAELARLAGEATCVIGHNIVRHDLPVLREAALEHPLLRLPAIDTLFLSPIAFPENPYHRLVKDYKLVRESRSDPVADARQAAVLFGDECRSLAALRTAEPGLFRLLHFLFGTPGDDGTEARFAAGMDRFFRSLGGVRPSPTVALAEGCVWVARRACRSAPIAPPDLATVPQRQALAFAANWLRVAGANSVLPPWVRLEHPLTGELIRRWRETPCAESGCTYCREVHDARQQLARFFGFPAFRETPRTPAGASLQGAVVEAGLQDESLLAILPTGGGKSLCFQLPALVRNHRRGVLTIVISPLQALMKDQVDGLVRRTGTPFAAALYGLLTPPERGDVLRGVRLGDVALLYVSPEQLRNRSFRDAIAAREIGCWVFDEAHCLSKWGHDFRPDYLYAGRFIREFSAKQGGAIPPVACFTATAKRDVRDEIVEFFRRETGRELRLFEGGVERDNLLFKVDGVTGRAKLERVHDLLADRLPAGASGSAIVFRATRRDTEVTSEFLAAKGWPAAHFHAGLTPSEKKRIQDEFLAGEVQVICATNAFGMGIDKEDVRLVIHADTPGSLENYLQEAGRAGRDGGRAECVLLYDEEDCEQQFRLEARSELSRRDIAQILRGLRKAARGGREEVVITTGEILRDEDVETGIDLEDRGADTKVRTAIAWLERAGFVQRDENLTQVFQARPMVRDLAEADAKIATLDLPDHERELWLAILRELMNAGPTESLTVDRLALLPELGAAIPGGANPEFVSARVMKTLSRMARKGLLKRDVLYSAFVRHGVVNHSRGKLAQVLECDRKLVDLLATSAPDASPNDPHALELDVRQVNQRLVEELRGSSEPLRLEESGAKPAAKADPCSMEMVRALLKSLCEDGRGFAGTHGSINLRYAGRDRCQVWLRRKWTDLSDLAEKRRRVASVVLGAVLGKIPPGTPANADLLVNFSLQELEEAVDLDLVLRSDLKDKAAAIDRALSYLAEHGVITRQRGLSVFHSAMCIRLTPEGRGRRYQSADFQPLQHHYSERVLQIHVMSEYARRGMERIREALGLVLAYFTLGKDEFVRRYLGSRPELLQHATTAQSFQRIVTDLDNPPQIRIVTAPENPNLLVLAGPGSGKTRTVVHRCAYLVRVKRVRPQSVLVCCFNRGAALELRRRLADLVGADARGVTILTYHGLAMRLLGRSFAPSAAVFGAGHGTVPANGEPDFDALITDAVALLRGTKVPVGLEPDEVRDRLLAGFRHILVDEYQDIDAPQYDLISAIAGRTLEDADQRLSIMAVGDDDQNIYTFRGANVEFIRRFRTDYDATVHYLVENHRSTRAIIETANRCIAANTDRMKTDHPIQIDRHRAMEPFGGVFAAQDRLTGGKVQVIRVRDAANQAPAVVAELQRLADAGVDDWSRMAVLSATHRELAGVRAVAEAAGIPIRWMADRGAMPPLPQVREVRHFLGLLADRRSTLARATALGRLLEAAFPGGGANPWVAFLARTLAAWREESDDAEAFVGEAIEFLYETCAETRRDFSFGEGVTLSTVHAAKGTEHDHVLLIGGWPATGDRARQEETRRAFYVGMTRARRSLTVFEQADVHASLPAALDGPGVMRRAFASDPDVPRSRATGYVILGLEDVHLGYPACFRAGHLVHAALAALTPGDRLSLRSRPGGGWLLCDQRGGAVARLSRKAEQSWGKRADSIVEIRVLALIHRRADQDQDPDRRQRCLVEEWEVPLVEVVTR
ncbi:MAG: RecQ family ATP-dependent DNA helicase [Verrucomicrobiales bacterium]|nr:RecQ family ATP-dependent DNA helicase [Verrucomicrobiales bacterium]